MDRKEAKKYLHKIDRYTMSLDDRIILHLSGLEYDNIMPFKGDYIIQDKHGLIDKRPIQPNIPVAFNYRGIVYLDRTQIVKNEILKNFDGRFISSERVLAYDIYNTDYTQYKSYIKSIVRDSKINSVLN